MRVRVEKVDVLGWNKSYSELIMGVLPIRKIGEAGDSKLTPSIWVGEGDVDKARGHAQGDNKGCDMCRNAPEDGGNGGAYSGKDDKGEGRIRHQTRRETGDKWEGGANK